MITKTAYFWHKNSLVLNLQIQTKASKNAIIGEHKDRLKISLTSAPENNRANLHLIKLLASYFGVPQKQVTIIKGHKNKYKSVSILEPQKNLDKFMQK